LDSEIIVLHGARTGMAAYNGRLAGLS